MRDEDRKKEASAKEHYEGICCEQWRLGPLSPLNLLSCVKEPLRIFVSGHREIKFSSTGSH